jgi:hypothetical protein
MTFIEMVKSVYQRMGDRSGSLTGIGSPGAPTAEEVKREINLAVTQVHSECINFLSEHQESEDSFSVTAGTSRYVLATDYAQLLYGSMRRTDTTPEQKIHVISQSRRYDRLPFGRNRAVFIYHDDDNGWSVHFIDEPTEDMEVAYWYVGGPAVLVNDGSSAAPHVPVYAHEWAVMVAVVNLMINENHNALGANIDRLNAVQATSISRLGRTVRKGTSYPKVVR